jgi:hypothetical protein
MSGSWLRVAAYDIVLYASFGVDAVALNARAISQQYNMFVGACLASISAVTAPNVPYRLPMQARQVGISKRRFSLVQ